MTAEDDASSEHAAKWLASIPADVIAGVGETKVVADYGFGAGPGCVAGKHWQGPCKLERAIADLVQYRHVLRWAHVYFEGGACLWFSRTCSGTGFESARLS